MRPRVSPALSALALVLGAAFLAPRRAAAQASGTLQASVTVLPTVPALELVVSQSDIASGAPASVRVVRAPEASAVTLEWVPAPELPEARALEVTVLVY